MEQTLDLAWEVLSILPRDELTRLEEEQIEKYYPEEEQSS
jgi:V/A-type H+-transporting ATPase subunit B